MRSSAHAVAAVLTAAFSCISIPPVFAAPVISEIMYRPGTGFPETTSLEYIEVHNPDAAAVDLSGWEFRSGVSYTFPAGSSIPAGGYAVVASSPAAVNAAFGGSGALGPWTAGASLSNNGEKITLSKPGVVPGTWTKVDEVSYASEGDWAERVRESTWNGWDWSTPANGGGKSLELRNPALSNDNGQNWTASTAVTGGTPGAPNSAHSVNVPPIIHSVKHSPAVPRSTESVTVSCEVNDEALPANRTATLFYRNGTGTFLSVVMTGDGGGRFSTVLAPAADKSIWEFYISSNDGAATRTWPDATSEGQNANCQYQVDNEVPATTADTYRLTLTAAENTAFQNVNSTSNRQFNQTLIVTRGSEADIFYRSSMRIRGNSSRSYQFRPLRISIPNDEGSLDGYTSFNLNPRSPYLQYFGMRLHQAAGLPAPNAAGVELRRNGVEYTTSSGGSPDYGRWVRMDEFGAELADSQWPAASSGNMYKKGRPDEYWRSTAPAPSTPDGVLDGWSKQNNGSANDWSDLRGFFSTYQSLAAPYFPGSSPGDVHSGNWNGSPFTGDDMEVLETVADTRQWARWFALMTILESNETNLSTGEDDDYACYFLPSAGGQRRLQILPNDLDIILGKGDDPVGPTARGLYDTTEQGSVFNTLNPLMGTSSIPGNAEFRSLYHIAIRELCGSLFSDATFPAFVDNHLTDWAPANIRTDIKTFAAQRCAYVLGLVGAAAIPPAAATAAGSLTQAHGTLIISEVLAANAAAHLNGGVYPDVIELQNTGASAMDLGGKSLSDDAAQPLKFIFPSGTSLAAGARLVLYADANFAAPGLHTGFSLDQSGDAVFLYDTAGSGGSLLDSVTFGPQAVDFSIGRAGAGLTTWALGTPSIGAANNVVAATGAPAGLRINEWLANPDFRVNEDFIEIHNPTALPVPMGGMILTDDFRNYPAQHILPALSFIGPGGFHPFKAKGSSATPGNPSELPFAINSTFGWLALIGANGAIADQVDIQSQRRDQSAGRSPDGGALYASYPVPSPGLPNGSLPALYQALVDSLRISEFIYRPTGGNDYEFVELMNIGAGVLDLSGVRFTSGIDYTFPAGTTLAPGAYKVVARSRAGLISRFPAVEPVLAPGQYSGALDNSGETITLSLPNPWDVAILNFRYETTWEPLTFSSGYSLTAVAPVTTAPRDWNEPETWTASLVADGTPGSDGPPSITSQLSASGITGDPFSYQITATRAPSQFGAAGLPAGLSVNAVSGVISGTPVQAGTFSITITAANTAGTDTETLGLTVSTSGPLHHFTWDHTTTSAEAGVPFPAWVSARDLQGRLVTAYSGTVPVTGTATIGGVSTATVVITEVTDENIDEFELQNTGSTTVNTTGWFVVIGNSNSLNNDVNSVTWPLPASVAPGATLRVAENTAPALPGRIIFPGPIAWSTSLNHGWIMLFDGTSTLKDFFAWGWTAAELATLSISVNSKTITTAGHWSGAGAPVGSRATVNNSWQRTGTKDNNTAADWVWAANATSWSTTNPGLTVPWSGGSSIPVSPSSISFTGGTFTGFLSVPAPATGVRLTSADTQSHSGLSALFDVAAAPADTDGDKMPDAWESANGLNSAVNDAAADLDKDGSTNRNEYYAGTDPRSSASRLRITSWTASPPAQVSLSWNASANRLYRVSSAASLTSWSNVPGQIYAPVAAGNQTATFLPPAGTSPRGFFRVELLTPP